MVALKEPNVIECSDHRTVRIRRRRIERKIEDVLGEDHFGFRKGNGTKNANEMLRITSSFENR